ncbi:MAG: class I SAM-dependent methyltransferase [Anaerolineae bacterium]|nr:class I SAM-dependent methyltransferase [Anaerolineae bacterium]
MLVGEICQLKPGMRQLDLCCGKAEMLCRWSSRWGIHGVGVDISSVFIAAARQRATELIVTDRITLVQGDAASYAAAPHSFDVVSCIGATWIGGGLVGTLSLMQQALKPGGLLLVGEPFWKSSPPEAAYAAMELGKNDFASLVGTLDRIESAGFELIEMVLSNTDNWDRYVAAQWQTIDDWLRANSDDPDADDLRQWNARWKRAYLEYERDYLGWGIFVMRAK